MTWVLLAAVAVVLVVAGGARRRRAPPPGWRSQPIATLSGIVRRPGAKTQAALDAATRVLR